MKGSVLRQARVIAVAVCGVAAALLVSPPCAHADEWNKRTTLTVNQPIQVTDRLLEPGTYVFRLLDSPSNRNVVQIFNRDQSRIIDTVMVIPRYRLYPADKSEFAFWETPPGTARALRSWFYPGDTVGAEFLYPRHLEVLTASLNTPAQNPMPAPAAEAAPAAATAAQPESRAAESREPNQPSQLAEAAAAEPQPVTEPQPAAQESQPAAEPPPAALPKTASPYPPIGLAGFLAVGLYGLLRRRRTV